jgi:hypothetical protein
MDECAIHDMQKKIKLSSYGGDSGSRNANKAVVVPIVETAFHRNLESDGLFCVGAYGRNWLKLPRQYFYIQLSL